MNRFTDIYKLREAGFKDSTILDEMTRWFSDDDIKKFFEDFVRVYEVNFEEEEDEKS